MAEVIKTALIYCLTDISRDFCHTHNQLKMIDDIFKIKKTSKRYIGLVRPEGYDYPFEKWEYKVEFHE